MEDKGTLLITSANTRWQAESHLSKAKSLLMESLQAKAQYYKKQQGMDIRAAYAQAKTHYSPELLRILDLKVNRDEA